MGQVDMVGLDIQRGQRTLSNLDAHNVPVDAAFWMLEDDDTWSFNLHTRLIEELPKRQALRRVRDAIVDSDDSLRLRDIKFLRETDRVLQLLRMMFSTDGEGISAIRFTNNTVNGELIRDIVALRL
ncbi:hypothetical protein [Gordonia terrae]